MGERGARSDGLAGTRAGWAGRLGKRGSENIKLIQWGFAPRYLYLFPRPAHPAAVRRRYACSSSSSPGLLAGVSVCWWFTAGLVSKLVSEVVVSKAAAASTTLSSSSLPPEMDSDTDRGTFVTENNMGKKKKSIILLGAVQPCSPACSLPNGPHGSQPQ